MARPGITYLEVAQAATTLQQKGESPTIDMVRKALGTGSNTTIATHLRKWRAEHQPAVSALTKTTLPPELLTQLQSLWEALQEKAKEKSETLEREHAQQIDDHQHTIQTLMKQAQTLQNERDQLSNANTMLQQQLDSAHRQQTQSEQKQQQMSIRLEEQQQRLNDRESAVIDLKEQTHHIQQNLDHFREASRQQREELILQHDGAQAELKQEINKLKLQLETERDRNQQVTLENEKNKYEAEKQSDEIAWLKEQSQERYDVLKEIKSQLKTAQSHNESLNSRNAELLSDSKVQRQQITQLEQSITEHKERWLTIKATEAQQSTRKPMTT